MAYQKTRKTLYVNGVATMRLIHTRESWSIQQRSSDRFGWTTTFSVPVESTTTPAEAHLTLGACDAELIFARTASSFIAAFDGNAYVEDARS